MPTQAVMQAIYMQYLLNKAKNQITDAAKVAFDPQGRVLAEVSLDDADVTSLLKLAGYKVRALDYPDDQKTRLIADLGRPITETTTVSLDISQDVALQARFKTTLIDAGVENIDAVFAKLNAQPKGSIIALQQEFHFHLSLAARSYFKAAPDAFAGRTGSCFTRSESFGYGGLCSGIKGCNQRKNSGYWQAQ